MQSSLKIKMSVVQNNMHKISLCKINFFAILNFILNDFFSQNNSTTNVQTIIFIQKKSRFFLNKKENK